MGKVLIIIIVICSLHNLVAQDIHFSQYYNTPLLINPANAGEHDGFERFSINYKSQWKSVMTSPYKTFAFVTDKSFWKDKFSGGLIFFNDKAGNANMSITTIDLALATKVNINKNNYLKFAIQAGWSQRSINTANVSWDSQFDGKRFDKSTFSGEKSVAENFSYLDIASGLLWVQNVNDNTKINYGFSGFHLLKPSYNYFNTESYKLNRLWCLHSDAIISFENTNMTLLPSFIYFKQGHKRELNIGSSLQFKLGMDSKYTGNKTASSISFGAFYRYTDALIAYLKIDYKKQLGVGISYDLNISKLNKATHMRGGTEITLIYIIKQAVVTINTK